MKLTLNGYYGFANYGDELFNLTTALAARRWWTGHDTDFLGPPVAGVDAAFRVPAWFPSKLYTHPGVWGKTARLGFLAGALLTRDLVVYAGGSTLSTGSIMKKIQRMAAERNIARFAAMGVSIGPFDGPADEEEAARFLRKFTYISVRDQASIDLLRRMQVPIEPHLARDLVGALPLLLPASPAASREPRTLGISLRRVERPAGEEEIGRRHEAAIFKGVERFAKRASVTVRIFNLNTHHRWGDQVISRELQGSLGRAGVQVEWTSAEADLIGCWQALAACSAVLSVRLHGSITAYLTGVPFSQVEYHRKCADFVEDIGQPAALRLDGDCVDPARVEQILDRLFRQPELPRLPRETYSAEAALGFQEVPWASRLQ